MGESSAAISRLGFKCLALVNLRAGGVRFEVDIGFRVHGLQFSWAFGVKGSRIAGFKPCGLQQKQSASRPDLTSWKTDP